MLIIASFALLESWEYFIALNSHILKKYGVIII